MLFKVLKDNMVFDMTIYILFLVPFLLLIIIGCDIVLTWLDPNHLAWIA